MNPYNKLTRGVGLYTGAFAPVESPKASVPDSPTTGTSWQDVAKVLTKTTVAVAQKTGVLAKPAAQAAKPAVQPLAVTEGEKTASVVGFGAGTLFAIGLVAIVVMGGSKRR